MKYKVLALILALTVVSWAQKATQTAPPDLQQNAAPAEKAKCSCCDKMASSDAKDGQSCCARHGHHAGMKDMSCCAGKNGKPCGGGKDAKSCMRGDKNVASCCKGRCCGKDAKDKTAISCCGGKCSRDDMKGCCSQMKGETAKNCCHHHVHG